jgi:hypothetical protein
MNTKPFDRSVGTVIKILNEPIVIKNNKLLMSCIVNDCLIDRIPLRYFRRLSNYRELSDFNSFTKRVYRTQNFIELHQLLQGKTIKVVAKTILSNGATAPNHKLAEFMIKEARVLQAEATRESPSRQKLIKNAEIIGNAYRERYR